MIRKKEALLDADKNSNTVLETVSHWLYAVYACMVRGVNLASPTRPAVSMKGPIMAKKKYYEGGLSTTNDMANMPQNVIIRKYPETPALGYSINDGMSGIDSQMGGDRGKAKGNKKPGEKI